MVFDGNGDLTNRYLYGPAVDQILADEQLDSLTAPGDVLWPLTDNLGTVRDLAGYDDATGDTTVVNHRTYTAFGQILSETDPTIHHRFAYTGRHWDDDAGLYHYRARWYDPALGRFLSEVPIGFEAGDGNLQRYVGNGATNAVDPSGLDGIRRAPHGDTPVRTAPRDMPEPSADLSPPPVHVPLRRAPGRDTPVVTQPAPEPLPYSRAHRTPPVPKLPTSIPPPIPQKYSIPEVLIARFGTLSRRWVLWGIDEINYATRDVIPPGERFGLERGKWRETFLWPGFVVGPTGTGPCVGLILRPTPWDSDLPVYDFHFGPEGDVAAALKRAGLVVSEPTLVDSFWSERGVSGYEAILSGGSNEGDGRANLLGVILVLRIYRFSIRGYVPTSAMYIDDQGTVYCGMGKEATREPFLK